MSSSSGSRRSIALLVVGGAIGVVLAGAGLVRSGSDSAGALPEGVVARVNGQIIRREEYDRMLAALQADRRTPLDADQERYVLDRLIDEELLVQRGLELGLAQVDRKIRADLTAAVISSIVSEKDSLQPTDAELQSFYDQNHSFFATTGRLRVRQVFCRVNETTTAADALNRANEAARRLKAGEDFTAVRDQLGNPELAPLPDSPLPPAKLRDYLGPTALQVVLTLNEGEVSDPIRSGTGYHVLQVVEREAEHVPPLADIKPQVVEEFRRRAGEKALRSYLDDLRRRASVTVAQEVK